MPLSNRRTLTQYLIEQRQRFPQASGALNALILDVALAAKAIARAVAFGQLGDPMSRELVAAAQSHAQLNVQGEVQKPLDVVSNEIFIRTTEWSGHLAGMGSEEMDDPYQIPATYKRGKYLLVFDPLDGSSNIDVNVSVGSIFSILRAPQSVVDSGRDVTEADFLQPGATQVAAGYAIYGPVTMLVLTVGSGVVGFTLDPNLGEFKLTHPDIRVPVDTQEFAINSSNSRFWESPIKRYVDECLAGKTGPRGKDFNTRWIASMVAEAHRILMRGGVFMYPRDSSGPPGRRFASPPPRGWGDLGAALRRPGLEPGRLRLLYEANPIGFVMEQAGGRASTGRSSVLEVQPEKLHQRVGLVFGSKNEVDRIERYHREYDEGTDQPYVSPLFNERSLYRPEALT